MLNSLKVLISLVLSSLLLACVHTSSHYTPPKPFSTDAVREDYVIFKEILTSAHPSLYEYQTTQQWQKHFEQAENQLSNINNYEALFTELSALSEYAKDGHLQVIHPTMQQIPPMFPLLLKIIDGKLYTDTNDLAIPLGSEILTIDDKPTDVVIKNLLKYAPSDGYNLTRKYRAIEKDFSIFYLYEYGAQNAHTVHYRTPNGDILEKNVLAQSFESLKQRNLYRSSYFAKFHNVTPLEHLQKHLQRKEPFVHYYANTNSAVLTVNSFAIEPKQFKQQLTKLFKEMSDNQVENLIIDIRKNQGGFRADAIILYSFLAKSPFKQRIDESTLINRLPLQQFVKYQGVDYQSFFNKYFDSAVENNDRWTLNTDHAQSEMKPHKDGFKGKVYVLTGGKTFSAGTAFALNAKNDTDIMLVGEETGGGYYMHTGQFPVTYELPNSKIRLNLSLVKINKYVKDKTVPKGSGVQPDIPVYLTVEDLIQGKDTVIGYVLDNLINSDN